MAGSVPSVPAALPERVPWSDVRLPSSVVELWLVEPVYKELVPNSVEQK